jgi:hypothetical protein
LTQEGNGSSLQVQRERRREHYGLCNAIVLLRARPDSMIELLVMATYMDRRQLFQDRRINIPWAMIDHIGGDLPIATTYRIPRVITASDSWPDELVRALDLDANPSPADDRL